MKPIKNILVLCSGGDAPGMNAAIRAVVRSCCHAGLQAYGAEMGFQGLVENHIFALDEASVANCIQRGGTILKTGRFLPFLEADTRAQAAANLKALGINALVVLGGDGSFRGAKLLAAEFDIACIGIPCTIDNDIAGTEYTVGFDTARNTALHAIDNIRDTAFSHTRKFLIEVMGKSSGFLALDVGLAGGAEFIITPEFPLTPAQIVQYGEQKAREKMASIIVIAEANHPGRSVQFAEELKHITGEAYRVCILGHTQRGGSPTALDRKIASLMGHEAVVALRQGANQQMIACRQEALFLEPFRDIDDATRFLCDDALLQVNQQLSS